MQVSGDFIARQAIKNQTIKWICFYTHQMRKQHRENRWKLWFTFCTEIQTSPAISHGIYFAKGLYYSRYMQILLIEWPILLVFCPFANFTAMALNGRGPGDHSSLCGLRVGVKSCGSDVRVSLSGDRATERMSGLTIWTYKCIIVRDFNDPLKMCTGLNYHIRSF
jgi:hypothetical protein